MITGLITILFLYAVVFIMAEVLYRRGYAAKETRKIVHIGAGIISFLLPCLVNLPIAISIGLFFVVLLFWTKKKQFLNSVHEIGNEGAILFPVGLIVCALIFWNINPFIFQGSALLVGLSDGLAGVVGQRFGKRRYSISGSKTIEGSVSFFVITLIILVSLVFCSQGNIGLWKVFFIGLGSLAITLVEGFLGNGWDNLFVPSFGGLVIYLLI